MAPKKPSSAGNRIFVQAERRGIETRYRDGRGHWRSAEPEALAQVLAALGSEREAPRGEWSEESALLSVPHQAWQGSDWPAPRLWILAVQLYGVRSERNWGIGDFGDLAALLDLAAGLGAAGIALNPLHALGDEQAAAASPYSPNSRIFLNPLYIDIEAIPELGGPDTQSQRAEADELRRCELVDYARVAKLKMRALELAYANFARGQGERQRAFADFRRDRGPCLTRFACFEVLRRRLGGPWPQWPPQWRKPDDTALAALRATDGDAIGFFEFSQWVAHQQLEGCRQRARSLGLPIGLYLDIAVGVRPDGFDAWYDQASILAGMSIGAPPDAYNTAGQNWGLAAFNPATLAPQGFAPFKQVLHASMQYAGAVRLDHVLGLKRLYLVPEGRKPDQGIYLRFPFEALLAACAQESVLHRSVLIGEDLGTVPDGFRDTLSDWGIWSYQVMLFERGEDGSFLSPAQYRENALVTFSTHDLATFAGWMSGHDLATKRALGMDPGETDGERASAHDELRRALVDRGDSPLDFAAVARFLAATPARLLVVAIEDALGVVDQANIPATVDEHPNWRRRLPVAIEKLGQHAGLAAVADVMRSAGRATPIKSR